MQRRKLLAAMGSIAAGGAATVGTGAFTSVSADRSLSVDVAGDNSAFLKFAVEDEPNGAYADVPTDGTLEIALDGSLTDGDGNPTGSGVNDDAYTVVRDIFTITNQGTQDVYVGVKGSTLPNKSVPPDNSSKPDKAIGFFSDDADKGAGLGVGEGYYSGSGLGLDEKGILLTPGETLERCGLLVYTPIPSSELPVGSVTFVAKSEDEVGSS
jgi:hypothetical protein